jgi:hypothetical protein
LVYFFEIVEVSIDKGNAENVEGRKPMFSALSGQQQLSKFDNDGAVG